MPNPFNLLSKKVKDKIARRDYERDSKYIIGDLGPIDSAFRDHLGIYGSPYEADEDIDEDEASSVSSFSTMATVDNNPGAGCTVDKYFYQPVGRRIEKIAFKIVMPYLPPGRIVQYIEENDFNGHLYSDRSLMVYFLLDSIKPIYMTGLKSLVLQTQSNSIIRSSAALSALIRICPTSPNIGILYQCAMIYDRASLVASPTSINNEDREYKCYLFLEILSWARPGLWNHNPVYNHRNHTLSQWKGSLLKLLQSWRTSDKDAFAIISEACIRFARVNVKTTYDRRTESTELHYFFTLFIIQFVPFIYYEPTRHKCKQRTQQLYHMVLSTFLRWLDSALYAFFFGIVHYRRYMEPSELKNISAILGLLLHDRLLTILLPATTLPLRKNGPFDEELLPRNLRHSGSHQADIHNLIKSSIPRTQRLLKSIDELEREILDSMTIRENKVKSKGHKRSDHSYTLKQAQRVHVLKSDTNKEFLHARSIWGDWSIYKRRCELRHKWGIYFRSNFDWDWDTASCLERLFELPEELAPPSAHIGTVDLDAGRADIWNISAEATLPRKMKVAYKSITGETKYKTIMVCPSSDDVASSCELTQDDEEKDGVSVILPQPRFGGGEEAAEGPGVVAHGNNDAAAARETDVELGVTDNRFCSDDSDNEEDTVEISTNLKVVHEQQVDQISICSLD